MTRINVLWYVSRTPYHPDRICWTKKCQNLDKHWNIFNSKTSEMYSKSVVFDWKSIQIMLTNSMLFFWSEININIYRLLNIRTWAWHDRPMSGPCPSHCRYWSRNRPRSRLYRVITDFILKAIKWSFRGSNWIDLVERAAILPQLWNAWAINVLNKLEIYKHNKTESLQRIKTESRIFY